MIDISGVFAIDGHDGSGKTTLARALAQRTNGSYQRTFQGLTGEALLIAAKRGEVEEVVRVGEEAISRAIAAAGSVRPIVLDRGWMTVASLIGWNRFSSLWHLWIPTALCWVNLAITLDRLARRGEPPETNDTHAHYLREYRSLAHHTRSYVLRTDLNSESDCLQLLLMWVKGIFPEETDSGFLTLG